MWPIRASIVSCIVIPTCHRLRAERTTMGRMSRKHPGSRHHAAIASSAWAAARRAVLDAAGWRCQAPGCGRAGRLEVHHVQELHKGGASLDLGNLTARCRPCHLDAHRRPVTPAVAHWRALVEDMTP